MEKNKESKMNKNINDVNSDKKNKKIKIIALILVLLSIVGGGTWYYYIQKDPIQVISGEYLGDAKDSKKMKDTELKSEEQKEIDKSKFNMVIKPEVIINIKSKTGNIFIQNPKHNGYPIDVEILVDNKSIYTTGAIEPGYEVTTILLDNNFDLKKGTYKGVARFKLYDENTKKKQGQAEATVNINVIDE